MTEQIFRRPDDLRAGFRKACRICFVAKFRPLYVTCLAVKDFSHSRDDKAEMQDLALAYFDKFGAPLT